MKKTILVFIEVALLSLPLSIWAQIPEKGFFLGGSLTALRMNGAGEHVDKDFEVTGDLFEMTATESYDGVYIEFEYCEGWNWKNKLLTGVAPIVGYRISPQFAIVASYNYYFPKKR